MIQRRIGVVWLKSTRLFNVQPCVERIQRRQSSEKSYFHMVLSGKRKSTVDDVPQPATLYGRILTSNKLKEVRRKTILEHKQRITFAERTYVRRRRTCL